MHLDTPDPFHPSSDPAAYVPRPASERALRELELFLRGGSLVAALLGPPGIGKTLLLRVLAERLEEEWRVVYLPYPHAPGRELCRWALIELGENPGTDAEGMLLQVVARQVPGRFGLLLLLDDADGLPLGSARRLYELAREAGGRLRLVLAGADPHRLERTLGMMADEIPVARLDEPMNPDETAEYVLSRLELVEADEATRELFSEETLAALHGLSQGVPAVLHEHAMAVLIGQGLPDAPPPPPAPSETSWEAVVVEAERERRDAPPPGPAPVTVDAAPAADPGATAPRPSTVLRGVAEARVAASKQAGPGGGLRLGRWLALALGLAALVVLGRSAPPWLAARLARPSQADAEGSAAPRPGAPPAPEVPMPVLEVPAPAALPEEPIAEPVPEAPGPTQVPGADPAPEAPVPIMAPEAEPTRVEPAPAEAPVAPAPAPAPIPGAELSVVGDALGPMREELERRGALPPPPPAPAPEALAPAGGAARVAVRVTAPDGAIIEIEGRRAGAAPLEGVSLPPGTYRFVARLPDGRVMQRTVTVSQGASGVVFP